MKIEKGVIFKMTHPTIKKGHIIFKIKDDNVKNEGQGTILLEFVEELTESRGIKKYKPDERLITVESMWFGKDTKRKFEVVTKQLTLF